MLVCWSGQVTFTVPENQRGRAAHALLTADKLTDKLARVSPTQAVGPGGQAGGGGGEAGPAEAR